jgi:hypothetical protein
MFYFCDRFDQPSRGEVLMNGRLRLVLSISLFFLLILPIALSGQTIPCPMKNQDPLVQAIACGLPPPDPTPLGINEAIRRSVEAGKPLNAREIKALVDAEVTAMLLRSSLPPTAESGLVYTVAEMNAASMVGIAKI